MPTGEDGKGAVAGGTNIDALPDGVLEHVLGFVPAQEAVRTCVLALRWRHLWKSATGLHITFVSEDAEAEPMESWEVQKEFVDHLLRRRRRAPLEAFKLRFRSFFGEYYFRPLNRWFWHAVTCKAQMIRLENVGSDPFNMDDLPLVSRHLTRLELIGAVLDNGFCDFSSCPSLKHLEIAECYLWDAKKISSESLKCLIIRDCGHCLEFRTLISVPSLVSLQLDEHWCRTPVFKSMPSLQNAFVRVTGECDHCCSEDDSGNCGSEECFSCYDIEHGSGKGLDQEGLSEVEHLTWIVESKVFSSTRDFKQWRNFSKLKTLLLNDYWCVVPDFHALTCILKHSPVLEKLTLQLFSKGLQPKVEMIGRFSPTERSPAIAECLKEIEVNFVVLGEEVFKILRFLCCKFNISFIFK